MPDDQPNPAPSGGEIVQNPSNGNPNAGGAVVSEAVQAQLLQIFGDGGNTYKPTKSQVDKILALQEKGMDYTHDERMKMSSRQKLELLVFGGVVVAFVLIIWIVAVKSPDNTAAAVTGAIAFLSGAGAGYGLGKSGKSKDE